MTAAFQTNDPVLHADFGKGRVEMADPTRVIVRFGDEMNVVDPADLTLLRDAETALARGEIDDARDLLLRVQSMAIQSLNAEWGVFSPSRITLLPHQLWVCRKVNASWPSRWLIADDVGLGKTVEAGLIIAPLVASGRAKRVLILCPAKLTGQWVKRMKQMFDLRFQEHDPGSANQSINAWDATHMVVASAHTIRAEPHRSLLLEAEPWDLVIVDEAHHANTEQRAKPSLLFSLLRDMRDTDRFESMLLFTGTPHRGKDLGFISLLSLLRPDLFDPDEDTAPQLPRLPEVMIRNNKANATDLEGNRIFTPVTTTSHDFSYTPEETAFYETLSRFIDEGLAYASTADGRIVMARKLVLTTLQKLAASSVAAVHVTLRRRVQVLRHERDSAPFSDVDDPEASEDEHSAEIRVDLVDDEIDRLEELIALAEAVDNESKIAAMLAVVAEADPDEPVLLFTEYKATQAAALSALEAAYGKGSTGFINGDDALDAIPDGSGGTLRRESTRETAAADFNAGRIRFLVSTEAAGEGIDLQERCAILIHVDMPWNPMRMHQRVGRLSRYGQKRPVAVHVLQNPDTVDARIHALLSEKLSRIQSALDASMEEREDIGQLVLGMTAAGFYDDLHLNARAQEGGLKNWFDAKTGEFGGESAVATAQAIFGSAAGFDFGRDGKHAPRLDLPDLENFLRNALAREKRRLESNDEGKLSFRAPDSWRKDKRMRDRYDGLGLERGGGASVAHTLGVGHPVMDRLLAEAEARDAFVGMVDGLDGPLLVFSVTNAVDRAGRKPRRAIVGMQLGADGMREPLDTAALIDVLRNVKPAKDHATPRAIDVADLKLEIEGAGLASTTDLTKPRYTLEGVLFPPGSTP